MITLHRKKTTQTNSSNPVDNRINNYKNLVYLRNKQILLLFKGKHKKLYEETINTKGLAFKDKLIMYNIAERIEILKKRYEVDPSILFLFLWKCLDLYNRPIFNICQNTEQEEKREIIDKLIKDGRANKTVFYLCSKHLDCAKDHMDFQGKIYIDENWRMIDDNVSIMEYLDKHKILTLQSVVYGLPYLITRPYCRHYFKRMYTDEVLNLSDEELLTKYDMITKVGDRNIGETRIFNAEARLNLAKQMYKYKKLPIIAKKISQYQKIVYNNYTQSIGG